ncbi:hypothetical protein MPDQ_002569 [Monascus purpureus]|uniref:Uncharacterized protein n=1 Tax=Monascus purpureus TaxID=5098 RepID=A0A507R3B5_MONPU|nr:hypothetical protein MPDQ_002569 [Monascus purpureus]
MGVQTASFPDEENQKYEETPTSPPRHAGNAGRASGEAIAAVRGTNSSGRRIGTGSGGVVTAPNYDAAESLDILANSESNRPLSKEEADRLYEERMEDEYAKREGGA